MSQPNIPHYAGGDQPTFAWSCDQTIRYVAAHTGLEAIPPTPTSYAQLRSELNELAFGYDEALSEQDNIFTQALIQVLMPVLKSEALITQLDLPPHDQRQHTPPQHDTKQSLFDLHLSDTANSVHLVDLPPGIKAEVVSDLLETEDPDSVSALDRVTHYVAAQCESAITDIFHRFSREAHRRGLLDDYLAKPDTHRKFVIHLLQPETSARIIAALEAAQVPVTYCVPEQSPTSS